MHNTGTHQHIYFSRPHQLWDDINITVVLPSGACLFKSQFFCFVSLAQREGKLTPPRTTLFLFVRYLVCTSLRRLTFAYRPVDTETPGFVAPLTAVPEPGVKLSHSCYPPWIAWGEGSWCSLCPRKPSWQQSCCFDKICSVFLPEK